MKQEAKHHWRGCSEQTRALCTAPRREDTAHQIWYQIFKHCSPPWAVHCTEHTLHGAVEKLLSKPQLPAKIPSNPAHPKGLLSHLVLFSLNYSNPAPFHIQPPLIYLFLLICTEDCGSPWSLEQVELCRLQIKHCVYLHFFRRFTISFYTESQVKPPNLMVCVITWVKQSSDCWLCPAHVIRISAIPLCQVNTTD